MTVDIIFRIAAIGILTMIVSQILSHNGKNEIATLSSLAGIIIVLVMVINMISQLFETVNNLFGLY